MLENQGSILDSKQNQGQTQKASTSQPNIEEEYVDSDETKEENIDGYKFGSSGFESDGNLSEESDGDL